MSLITGDTPRPFQPPVAQRDIEAEVIYCVGGVISPVIMNVALHGMEQAAGVRYWEGGATLRAVPGTPVLVRYADLSGRPDKSAYADSRIMPPARY